MIEIPEAAALAGQLNDTITGREVAAVIAGSSPHKFAWYEGSPDAYQALLKDKTITGAGTAGGMLEIAAEDALIVLSEGAYPEFHLDGSVEPKKHQLLLKFKNSSFLSVSVRMYGGILAFHAGEGQNPYYILAKEKPSPLSEIFTRDYFESIISAAGMEKLSAKALLATEQRIPGLGNGTLQDILYHAGIHPKRKTGTLSKKEFDTIYMSIKSTLTEMASLGGRDTEKDLFGQPGGYTTMCSKLTVGKPCTACGSLIEKTSYMGGSIYFCPLCQLLQD